MIVYSSVPNRTGFLFDSLRLETCPEGQAHVIGENHVILFFLVCVPVVGDTGVEDICPSCELLVLLVLYHADSLKVHFGSPQLLPTIMFVTFSL